MSISFPLSTRRCGGSKILKPTGIECTIFTSASTTRYAQRQACRQTSASRRHTQTSHEGRRMTHNFRLAGRHVALPALHQGNSSRLYFSCRRRNRERRANLLTIGCSRRAHCRCPLWMGTSPGRSRHPAFPPGLDFIAAFFGTALRRESPYLVIRLTACSWLVRSRA